MSGEHGEPTSHLPNDVVTASLNNHSSSPYSVTVHFVAKLDEAWQPSFATLKWQ